MRTVSHVHHRYQGITERSLIRCEPVKTSPRTRETASNFSSIASACKYFGVLVSPLVESPICVSSLVIRYMTATAKGG